MSDHGAGPTQAVVTSVSRRPDHNVSKHPVDSIRLVTGRGVEGDAHMGESVQHRSRLAPAPPRNLRQVHLVHSELHDELATRGFTLAAGEMGENVTTRGIDLLALPRGTRLRLGADAVIEVTGLREPCRQLDQLQPGLMKAVLERDVEGRLVLKAGVMAVVLQGGDVRAGDVIGVDLPAEPHSRLEPV